MHIFIPCRTSMYSFEVISGNDSEVAPTRYLFLYKSNLKRKLKKSRRKVQGVPQSQKNVREKSRECHNHKPQPFPDTKRKRKPTNPNKHKSNKRTKSTKISSLYPKRGNRNAKRTEKHKNKMTQGKTKKQIASQNKPQATKSKTNTGTTVLEQSAE